LLQCSVISLQNNATPHYHRNVKALLQDWKWEILKYPPYSLDLVPGDLSLFFGMRSRQRFDTEDTINTAILESLCHLGGDDYEAATDQLPQ
jgi:hypothetical protein